MTGWKRIALGAAIGFAFGGPAGSVLGAAAAHMLGNRASSRRRSSRRPFRQMPSSSQMEKAYAALGATPADSVDELKRKYRALAKALHPDLLRAKGVAGETLIRATDRMVRVNAAWKIIREGRGIK